MNVEIPCICPGTPHETDTVTLREKLDFFGAATIRNAVVVAKVDDGVGTAEIMTVLCRAYLIHGIESWTLVDEDAKPVPVSAANIEGVLLPHVLEAMEVSDAADALYQEVMLPLLLRVLTPSQPSPTGRSTSRTNGSSRKRPKQSPPSSTTTIPTADTATTTSSLDGDSRSSQSAA